MKKIAIIGASYLQAPLILAAKDMGLERMFSHGNAGILAKVWLTSFIRSVL